MDNRLNYITRGITSILAFTAGACSQPAADTTPLESVYAGRVQSALYARDIAERCVSAARSLGRDPGAECALKDVVARAAEKERGDFEERFPEVANRVATEYDMNLSVDKNGNEVVSFSKREQSQ